MKETDSQPSNAIRCRCGASFALKLEESLFSLKITREEIDALIITNCPHCGRTCRITAKGKRDDVKQKLRKLGFL